MVAFAAAIGTFMDQAESLTAESLATFRAAPAYCLDDYEESHGPSPLSLIPASWFPASTAPSWASGRSMPTPAST